MGQPFSGPQPVVLLESVPPPANWFSWLDRVWKIIGNGLGVFFRIQTKTISFVDAGVQIDVVYDVGPDLLRLLVQGNMRGGVEPSTGVVRVGNTTTALGGGAAAALGTIGGSGPAVAAQNTWLKIKDRNGTIYWLPVWR